MATSDSTQFEYVAGEREHLPLNPKRSHRYRCCILALNQCLRDYLEVSELGSGSKVLDYGCGIQQYREFLPKGCEYMGADLPGNSLANIEITPDGGLPVEDQSIDLLLSTQVLEHVDDPDFYLSESFRVLRPGGRLLLCTHGVFRYHPGPNDYWRWTHTGLLRIVRQTGFEVEQVRGLVGGSAAALQMFQDLTMQHLPGWLRPGYCAVLQTLMGWLDAHHSEAARLANAWDYAVLARKP